MKRGLSFLLACLLIMTSTAVLFTGCEENDESKMLVSEWLYLVNNSFGFSGYSQIEPYILSISSDSESFDDVQTAFEFSVLPEELTELDLDKRLTREFCALTLAGAIGMPDTTEISISDYDKLTYPESVLTILNYDVMALDESNSFNPNNNVEYDEAVEALEKARYVWNHYSFETLIQPDLQENVIDLGGLSTVVVNSDGKFESDSEYILQQVSWLDNNNFSYNSSTGLLTLSNINEKNIKEGDIITFPPSLAYPEGLSVKVEAIRENDNGIYDISTSQPELEEIYKDGFIVQQSDMINFTEAIIYDGDGRLISGGSFEDSTPENGMLNLSANSESGIIASETATFSYEKKFEVDLGDGIKVKATLKNGSVSFQASLEDKSGYAPFTTTTKKSLTYDKTFSDFKFDCKVALPYWWNQQRLALNYNVTDKVTFKASATDSTGSSIAKKDKDKSSGNTAGAYELRQAMKALSQVKATNPLAASKTICTAIVPVVTGVSIRVVFDAEVTLEGAIEITIKYAGCCAGVEKRARSLSVVSLNDGGHKETTSVSGSIKAELTAGVTVAACVAGISAVDVKAQIGIGAEAKGTLNEIDQQRVPYKEAMSMPPDGYAVARDVINNISDENEHDILVCIDLKVYPVLKITALTSDCALGKLTGSFTWSILDSKSTPIISSHGELYQWNFAFTECTLQDRLEDGLERGDSIIVEPGSDVSMNIGEIKELLLKQIPETPKKYYTLNDIVVESSDISVVLAKAEFDYGTSSKGNGIKAWFMPKQPENDSEKAQKIILTAVNSGDAVITVKTRDGLFKNDVKVHVNTPEETGSKTVTLATFSASVAVNDRIKLTVKSIPGGKTDDSVFWESDNDSIASVNPNTGEITGISEGDCTIKAYVPGHEDSGVYCLISVTKDYTATNVDVHGSPFPKQWIKIDGQPVIIFENV